MKEGVVGAAVLITVLLLVAMLRQAVVFIDQAILPGGEWSAPKNIIYCLAALIYLANAGKFIVKRKRALLDAGRPTFSLLVYKRIGAGRRQ